MEQRIVSLEERMNKLEEKTERQSVEVAEMRVYVKEIYKRLDELKTNIALISEDKSKENQKTNDRMAKIIEKSIWAIVMLVGYFIGKGGV